MNRRMAAPLVAGLALLGLVAGITQGGIEAALVGLTAGGGIGVMAVMATGLSGSSQLLAAGLLVLFLGERMLGSGTERMVVSGAGMLVVLASIGIRARAMAASDGRLAAAHRLAMGASLVVLGGLALYGLTLESAVSTFFTDDEAIYRWTGTLGALWPILVLTGMVPLFAIDRVIGNHPKIVPPRAVREAATQALAAALAVALVFPVNYLASRHEWTSDVAYFRTTKAGSSSIALVKSLPEPVEAILFFPPGNDVGREVEPYFASLAEASGGMLKVNRVDQALAPDLAEELKVRNNGFVAFRMGDSTEKFKVGEDLKKAKRNLKKLDETAQKNLLKVTRGKRHAYFVVGHGEANYREREDTLRKLALFKKVLESQNYKAHNLGAAEGLANTVPADADLVVLAAPEKPLLPEETESLKTYLDQGGAMLVMTDLKADPMADLLGHMGVSAGTHPLAHAKAHIRQTRGPNDRILLATNRYGSHKAVRTLSKNGTTMQIILPAAVKLEKAETVPGKVHTLVRSFPDTWEDLDNDRQKDPEEAGAVFDLAMAVTGPEAGEEKPWRAVVVGDVNWASDPVIQASQGNQLLLLDGVRWLVGDDDLAGEVSNEEDVKIQHTKGQDWIWFYLTVLAMPLLVFGFGAVSIMRRRS